MCLYGKLKFEFTLIWPGVILSKANTTTFRTLTWTFVAYSMQVMETVYTHTVPLRTNSTLPHSWRTLGVLFTGRNVWNRSHCNGTNIQIISYFLAGEEPERPCLYSACSGKSRIYVLLCSPVRYRQRWTSDYHPCRKNLSFQNIAIFTTKIYTY